MQYAWKIVGTGVPDGPWHHVVSELRALRELDDDDATIPESRLWRDEGVHLQQPSPVLLDRALLLARVDKKDAFCYLYAYFIFYQCLKINLVFPRDEFGS